MPKKMIAKTSCRHSDDLLTGQPTTGLLNSVSVGVLHVLLNFVHALLAWMHQISGSVQCLEASRLKHLVRQRRLTVLEAPQSFRRRVRVLFPCCQQYADHSRREVQSQIQLSINYEVKREYK